MTRSKELGKNSVEQLELSGRPPESIVRLLQRVDGVLDVLNDEGMVADLSELHDGVVESFDDGSSTARDGYAVRWKNASTRTQEEEERDEPLLVDSFGCEEAVLSVGRVDLLLESAHLALDDLLDLVR